MARGTTTGSPAPGIALAGLALALVVASMLASILGSTPAAAQRMTDEEVRSRIVADYVAGFRAGDCPCPYSYAWNGVQCADKSLYSRRTGRDVFCYPADVTWQEMRDYRERNDVGRRR